jgi:hypothetical protein
MRFTSSIRLPNFILSPDYAIFTTIVIFFNCVYPNPPCQLSFPVRENRRTRRKATTFGRALTDSFHMHDPFYLFVHLASLLTLIIR